LSLGCASGGGRRRREEEDDEFFTTLFLAMKTMTGEPGRRMDGWLSM
jgi:hypothetical protein